MSPSIFFAESAQNGVGVLQNYASAAELYQITADKGYSDAENQLGCQYKNDRGIRQDCNRARELYEMAADQGNKGAQFNLALRYEYDQEVHRITHVLQLVIK